VAGMRFAGGRLAATRASAPSDPGGWRVPIAAAVMAGSEAVYRSDAALASPAGIAAVSTSSPGAIADARIALPPVLLFDTATCATRNNQAGRRPGRGNRALVMRSVTRRVPRSRRANRKSATRRCDHTRPAHVSSERLSGCANPLRGARISSCPPGQSPDCGPRYPLPS